MKKYLLLLSVLILSLSGCNKEQEPIKDIKEETVKETTVCDIDLASMSQILAYSEAYNIKSNIDAYVGKTIKMRGQCLTYKDEATGKVYYNIMVYDAAGCCMEGFEFTLPEGVEYPPEYSDIVLTGKINTYTEGTILYAFIENAEMEIVNGE